MRMLASPSPSGFAQDRAFYRRVRVDLGGHPEAARRFELPQRVERARGHGLTLKASLALLGLARSTHHDWRGRFERDGMRGLAEPHGLGRSRRTIRCAALARA